MKKDLFQLAALFLAAAGVYGVYLHMAHAAVPQQKPIVSQVHHVPAPPPPVTRPFKVAHIFVPLCDNENQGIVPVPEHLGNGQDPEGNLYWGARYGVKTFFKQSSEWEELSLEQPLCGCGSILKRAAFRRRASPDRLIVAEAYSGIDMTEAIKDFLKAAAGILERSFEVRLDGNAHRIDAGGAADLVAFVGHNGLMDAPLEHVPERMGRNGPVGAVVLACKSLPYFKEPLQSARCPLWVGTTGFMAPEAYALDAVLSGWIGEEPPSLLCRRAAEAYARYQRCNARAAERLFAPGP